MIQPKNSSKKANSKFSRVLAAVIAVYTLFNLLFSLVGVGIAGGAISMVLTIFVLGILGLTIGLVSAKARAGKPTVSAAARSITKRANQVEDDIVGAAVNAAKRAKARPEITFLRGQEPEEDGFVISSQDPVTRRREQLETLYRAGLYTREEYAAEREKLRVRSGRN